MSAPSNFKKPCGQCAPGTKIASCEVTVTKFEKSDDFTENTSESDFCEIFSSETEFYNTSDEEDAEKLE